MLLDLPVDGSSPNALALEHLNQSKITILASKSASKYRIQADSLAALVLPICELERRLLIHSNNTVQVLFDGPLPVQELWSQVENHYELHNKLKDTTVQCSRPQCERGIQHNWIFTFFFFQDRLTQAVSQFEVFQMEFHNQVLNTGSSSVADTFSVLQLAHDLVMDCIQQLEKLEEVLINQYF